MKCCKESPKPTSMESTGKQQQSGADLFKGECLEVLGVNSSGGHSLLLQYRCHASLIGHGFPLHPAPGLPPTLGGVLTVQAQLPLCVGLRLHLDSKEGVAQHAQQIPCHAAAHTHTHIQRKSMICSMHVVDAMNVMR